MNNLSPKQVISLVKRGAIAVFTPEEREYETLTLISRDNRILLVKECYAIIDSEIENLKDPIVRELSKGQALDFCEENSNSLVNITSEDSIILYVDEIIDEVLSKETADEDYELRLAS